MINGVDIIFIIPPIVVLLVAVLVGVWQLSRHGVKRGILSAVLVLLVGALIVCVLVVLWLVVYYAGGGH